MPGTESFGSQSSQHCPILFKMTERIENELLQLILACILADEVSLLKPLHLINPLVYFSLNFCCVKLIEPPLYPLRKDRPEFGGHLPELMQGLQVIEYCPQILKLGFWDIEECLPLVDDLCGFLNLIEFLFQMINVLICIFNEDHVKFLVEYFYFFCNPTEGHLFGFLLCFLRLLFVLSNGMAPVWLLGRIFILRLALLPEVFNQSIL